MMTEKRFNVFLARLVCCFPFCFFTFINYLIYIFFWTEHEMMICFYLNYASGIRRESSVRSFKKIKKQKKKIFGEGDTWSPV